MSARRKVSFCLRDTARVPARYGEFGFDLAYGSCTSGARRASRSAGWTSTRASSPVRPAAARDLPDGLYCLRDGRRPDRPARRVRQRQQLVGARAPPSTATSVVAAPEHALPLTEGPDMTSFDRRTLLKAGLATAGGARPRHGRRRHRAGRRRRRGSTGRWPAISRVPWGMAFLPNGNALVGERDSGDVHVVRRGGGRHRVGTSTCTASCPAPARAACSGWPCTRASRRNRLVYAYLSTSNDNRIVRMRFADGKLGARDVVLAGIPMNVHHNGGGLVFGPDGLLYASTGDGEVGSRAQSRTLARRQGAAAHPGRRGARGQPVRQLHLVDGPPERRGHHLRRRAARCGPASSARRRPTSSTRSSAGANYGWPRVEGSDGAGGFRDPLAQWSPTSICSPAGVAVANSRAWLGALRGECLYSVTLRGPDSGDEAPALRAAGSAGSGRS